VLKHFNVSCEKYAESSTDQSAKEEHTKILTSNILTLPYDKFFERHAICENINVTWINFAGASSEKCFTKTSSVEVPTRALCVLKIDTCYFWHVLKHMDISCGTFVGALFMDWSAREESREAFTGDVFTIIRRKFFEEFTIGQDTDVPCKRYRNPQWNVVQRDSARGFLPLSFLQPLAIKFSNKLQMAKKPMSPTKE